MAEMAFENMRNQRTLIKFAKAYIRSSLSLFDRLLRLKEILEDGRSKIRDPKEVQRHRDTSYTPSFSNAANDHQALVSYSENKANLVKTAQGNTKTQGKTRKKKSKI